MFKCLKISIIKSKYFCEQLCSSLEIQLNNAQLDFDKLRAQLEEETEAANDLRSQNQKLANEYAHLKSRYDKDIISKGDEFDDYRCVFIKFLVLRV